MIIPTEEQFIERWDSLPMSLKEALTSDANSDLVWKVAEAEHVPDKKIYEVGRAVSHVLMGFIHPEDFAAQLRDESRLNPQTVDTIFNQLNQKIFLPLQQDIKQVYGPLAHAAAAPKMISESFQATINPASKPAAMPIPPPKPQQIPPKTAGVPVGVTPPQPIKSAMDAGWSRQTSQDPVVKLGVIMPTTAPPLGANTRTIPPLPKPAMPQPITAQTPTSAIKGMSEFERLDMLKKGAVPTAKPPAPVITPSAPPVPTPAKPPEPAPIMLHQVSTSAPQSGAFRMDSQTQNQITGAMSERGIAQKPAVIELGDAANKATGSNTQNMPRLSQPPLPAPPGASGPRQVTEITNQKAPMVSQPAPPPMPPKPPQPSASPEKKVVNYL